MKIPTYKKILDYWFFKNGKINKINSITKKYITKSSIDYGEPTCWACGEHWNGKYDISGEYNKKDIYKAWQSSPLERCHIIPDSLGGLNVPSNIFLMCKDCHVESPDTIYSGIFFSWLDNKKTILDIRYKMIIETFNGLGIDISKKHIYESINSVFKTKKTRKNFYCFLEKNTSSHFGVISPFTIIGALQLYINKPS